MFILKKKAMNFEKKKKIRKMLSLEFFIKMVFGREHKKITTLF